MFANIHSCKKLLIHFDIICDPFPGRFTGASSFVYGKQKFAKYSESASLNICFRNDVLKLFIISNLSVVHTGNRNSTA